MCVRFGFSVARVQAVGRVHGRFIVRIVLEGGGWRYIQWLRVHVRACLCRGREDTFRPSLPRPWL